MNELLHRLRQPMSLRLAWANRAKFHLNKHTIKRTISSNRVDKIFLLTLQFIQYYHMQYYTGFSEASLFH